MIFKQKTLQSLFTGVSSSVNSQIIKPFANAEQVIWKYNQAIQHNSLTQKGWERLLAQSDDSMRAYLTSIKGSTASMTGYTTSLQGNITGFKKVSSAISQYNTLSAQGVAEQKTFATAVSTTNGKLGTYLSGLNGAKASMGGYIKSLITAKAASIGLKVATVALNASFSMGISLLVSKLISSITEYSERISTAAEKAGEALDTAKSNVKELNSLIKEYNDLQLSNEWDNTDIETKKQLQKDINALLDDEADKLDIINGKYEETTAELYKQKLAKLSEQEKSAYDALEAEKDALWDENKYTNLSFKYGYSNKDGVEYYDDLDVIEKYVKEYDDVLQAWKKTNLSASSSTSAFVGTDDPKNVEELITQYDRLKQLSQEMYDNGDTGAFYDNINSYLDELEERVKKIHGYETDFDDAQSANNLGKILTDPNNGFGGYIETLEEYQKVVDFINNSDYENKEGILDVLASDFYEFATQVDNVSGSLEELKLQYQEAVDKRKELYSGLNYVGNVDINNRPVVVNDDGTYSTTSTSFQERQLDDGSYEIIHFTPILPDGTVLEGDALNEYLDKILNSSDVLSADNPANGGYGLVYKVDTEVNGEKITDGNLDSAFGVADAWDVEMHNLQDKMYRDEAELKIAIKEFCQNPNEITDSFTSIFNSEDFEESKEALLELATAGEISTDVIESSEEYRKLITETGLSAIEATERIRKMVDATTRLSDMSSDLGTLSTAYKEFKENGYASVESIEALREKFGDLKNAKGEELFENFAYVIGSSTATTEEQQKAFNNLVSAYLTSEKVFEKLTDENKDYYITQLKAMGVMNSEALITNELAGKKKALELQDEALTITADGFNKATSEKIKALMGENAAAQSCRIALFQLTANEQIFNSNTLDTNGKVKALVELASAYGVTSEYIEKAQNAINADEANGGHTGLNFTGADVKRAMKDVYEGVYGSIADYEFNFDLGLGDIDFGLDEDSTKDSTDNIFDWIETRISRLQNAFQNMVDSVTKYVSQNFKLDSIDKQITSLDKQISTYYAGAEKYLEKANSITLSDDLRNKVINGKIEIEEISDETTREAVTEFKEWYEKYLDAIDNAAQLERDKRDKLREKLDARTWALQQQRERLSTKSDRKHDAIDFKESLEGSANTSEYQWLINNADKQYENINAENTLLKEYLATLDSTSEEWADIQSQIESNESSMRDLISSQVEWNNKIAQMPIDKAEKAIEKLSGKEERINAKYENTNSSWAKRQLNDSLADIKTDTLKQYRNAYESTKDNYNTSAWNINQMSSKDSLVAKVQKYTKSGKEIPSDVLSSVYGNGNTLLIRRCEQYNAAYLARETAKDTYDLNKEQIKTDLADLGQKNLDTITDAYANKNTTIDNKKSLINARKENTEAKGKYADESYYNQLLTQVSRQVDAKVSERNKLKEIIDQNIKDGLWTKESQMYKDAMAQVDQLGIEIVELGTEQANYNNELNQMPIDRLQTALDILDKLSSRDSSKNDLKKALGKDLSVDDYQKEFNNIKAQEDKTLQLRNKYYQKYINAKQKGRDADADKYLQLYYEEDTALNNLKVSFEELKDEMRDDVYWRDFERAHKAAENLKTTIASIIDLYSDEMLFTDNGALTDMGVSKMGALLKEYELAKTEVVNYTNDLKNLNNLYENGLYPNEEEYKEKLAEIKNGLLDATKETKSYNDALRDMVISQKEIELEALNELIDKRKEALNAKKEYYDYDKTIKEQTKDVQSLQAKIAALEGVETAEAKAQLARNKSELQEAMDDLEETKFDHKLEVILDGFDLLQTDLQDNHDAYVKNLKSSFDEQIEIISNANSLIGQSYSEVIRSITNMLQFYGVDTSSIDVGSLAGFATGGIVRAVRRNGDSALVSVNPDETILTKKFTDLLPDTVQMMSQFVNIPKMNYDFAPGRNDTPVININYDKMLNIEGNVFDMEKATMDVVKNNMKTIAKGVSNDLSTQWRKLGHK